MRVEYVPTSAPSATTPATAEATETLMIEEPPPPPASTPPAPAPAPKPVQRPRRIIRNHPDAVEVAPETAQPPPTAPVPALEPQENPGEEAALRRDILKLQQDLQQRSVRLDRARVSGTDRRTLEDARAFLTQSQQAMEQGDLQRSLNLARKSHLLLVALEQGH